MAVKDPAVMLRSMNHLRVRGAVLVKVVIAVAILLDSFVSDGVFTRAEIGLLPGTTFAQRNSPRSAYDFKLLAYQPVMRSMQKRTNPAHRLLICAGKPPSGLLPFMT
jgi:hypothetical protein